ncbi:histone methylation protein [Nitzschia inconspicua]|uniref:Histone methylation protein n=1 Tax=Nitzschia inconspicua TaxID=303405 RepID=A0A9K3KDZ8_9STRA|nr:histone methylation protein [Nitzschia inconspicua]
MRTSSRTSRRIVVFVIAVLSLIFLPIVLHAFQVDNKIESHHSLPYRPALGQRLRIHSENTTPDRSLSGSINHNDLVHALENMYPSTALDQRIALSRKDGYWPYIQKGEDPPQALVYGEFDLQFFGEILERAALHYTKPQDSVTTTKKIATASEIWQGKVFCDLGSGTGRLVLAAAALYPWKVCRGIELLEGIHHEAVETLRKCSPSEDSPDLNDSIQNNQFSTSSAHMVAGSSSSRSIPLSPIELRCGSFNDPYEFYGDADLIFVFSTCMDTHVLINLARSIGRQCQPGCLVLTTEYKLPLGGKLEPLEDDPEYPSGEYALELVESITGTNQATGGESTVHIHRVTKALGNGSPRPRPQLTNRGDPIYQFSSRSEV